MVTNESPARGAWKPAGKYVALRFLALWVFVGLCLPGGSGNGSNEPGVPVVFQTGETMHFQVEWNSFYVGDVFLAVLPVKEFRGVNTYHFMLTAKTRPIIEPIYKAQRRIDSLVDVGLTRSLRFEKRDELDEERHVVVYFDWEKQTVRYTRLDKRRQPVPVPPGTFDPLGVFYAFRQRDLREGVVLKAPVTDGKRCVIAEARVLRRETLQIATGTYDTYVVEPDLGRVILGVFKKRKDAKLLIWVTADEHRIPVRVESDVAIGSFVAELVSRKVIPVHAALPRDVTMVVR